MQIKSTPFFKIFSVRRNYCLWPKAQRPPFHKGGFVNCNWPPFPGCGKPLSSTEILHKNLAVVKTTRVEKVRILSFLVTSVYVNQKCIHSGAHTCGKLLWKTLWRVWKTVSFQQLFPLLALGVLLVENSAYPHA